MKTTWNEIKTSLYRLMFLTGNEAHEYDDYLTDAANFALMEVATKVMPIMEQRSLSVTALTNGIPPDKRSFTRTNADVFIRTADSPAKAYSFTCDGNGICTAVLENGATLEIPLASDRIFVRYKGFAPESGIVALIFGGEHAYNVKDAALFAQTLSDDAADIPDGGRYARFDMDELTRDETEGRTFFAFAEDAPVLKRGLADGERGELCKADYMIERGSVLYLNAEESAQYEVFYKRYPAKITADTSEDFEMELAPEACSLIPLLMAYRIFKDDDERKAVMYFNDYQSARAEILRPMTAAFAVKVWGGEE